MIVLIAIWGTRGNDVQGTAGNVETVQTGYLGEYTDITVQELFDGYYQTMLGCESAWDGGETEEGKQIVQVTYSSENMDSTTIQFTMLDDQVFKITALVDPLFAIDQASDLSAALNNIYLMLYMSQHESEAGDANFEQALVDRLDQVSGSAVLYGASADYAGDRSELCTLFGDSPLEVSVPWMLDAYGYFDMTNYASNTSDAVAEDTPDEDYIFPSDRQYITEADMANWDQNTASLARNEIYARHGYVFQTQEIQNYFAAKEWYSPNPSYDGSGLSDVEKANVDAILVFEQKKGWTTAQTVSPELQAQQTVEDYLSNQGIAYTGIDYVRARSEGGYQVCVKQLESGNEYEVVYVVQFNNDIASVVGTETWGTFEPF